MSENKVDLEQLEHKTLVLARFLKEKRETQESSGLNRAIMQTIGGILDLVLTTDELEMLKRYQRLKASHPQLNKPGQSRKLPPGD